MNKISLSLAAAAMLLCAAACSPMYYPVSLQMRYPSPSGLDPVGKSISIVYLEDGSMQDSLYNNCFSDGLAQGLESVYFGSDKAVEVFDVLVKPGQDYSSRDSLVSLVMATGTDVVMLVDRPEFASDGSGTVSSSVHIYDSMDRRDTVRTVSVSGRVTPEVSESSLFPSDAQYLGLNLSKQFNVRWEEEAYVIIYFDTFSKEGWDEANRAVDQLDWATAAKYWTEIAESTDNATRLSCAAYDLAVACLMQGEPALALEWLDLSDRTYPVSLSPNLRKRIKARL